MPFFNLLIVTMAIFSFDGNLQAADDSSIPSLVEEEEDEFLEPELLISVREGNIHRLQFLLAQGEDINWQDED